MVAADTVIYLTGDKEEVFIVDLSSKTLSNLSP